MRAFSDLHLPCLEIRRGGTWAFEAAEAPPDLRLCKLYDLLSGTKGLIALRTLSRVRVRLKGWEVGIRPRFVLVRRRTRGKAQSTGSPSAAKYLSAMATGHDSRNVLAMKTSEPYRNWSFFDFVIWMVRQSCEMEQSFLVILMRSSNLKKTSVTYKTDEKCA